jgi:hypothetical protein
MKIRHLFGLDAIALAHFIRPNPRQLAGADGIEDRRARRSELKRVTIAACHQCGAAAALFGACCGGEEIVGFVTRALGVGEAAGGDEFRNERKLLDQIVVEFPAALIIGEGVVSIGRRLKRVPADQHRARPLGAIELQ